MPFASNACRVDVDLRVRAGEEALEVADVVGGRILVDEEVGGAVVDAVDGPGFTGAAWVERDDVEAVADGVGDRVDGERQGLGAGVAGATEVDDERADPVPGIVRPARA